jgi:hypothetical protein
MNMPVESASHCIGTSWMPSSSACGWEPHTACDRPSTTNVRPIVAMNSVIGGWFTSGRSTTFSMPMPSSTMTASVIASASQKFTPILTIETKVSAARNTIAPCAKLNTPEAL